MSKTLEAVIIEIHQSAPFFKDLLQQGAKLIAEIRD